jgi:hypothetical protein
MNGYGIIPHAEIRTRSVISIHLFFFGENQSKHESETRSSMIERMDQYHHNIPIISSVREIFS